MLEQVVVNLAVNARDAMPGGGHLTLDIRQITVEAADCRRHADATPGHFACLTVTDTGCGMDAETLGRIFEPFFTTKEVGKGTGLGLATVYGIVQQHLGWIEVESQVGVGSTFRAFLPLSAQKPAEGTELPVGAPRGHETILLVEDEARVREPAAVFLRHAGYHVLEAVTGAEARDVWHRHGREVDVLVSDVIMPGGFSGRGLVEALRRERPSLKCILMSGYSPDTRLPQGPGIVFLAKPFPPSTLARVIREVLDGRHG
jgi:CheY-like chemotaxis protein